MKSNSLVELFGIEKGDVVSITGSGGKTTLLFALSEELKTCGRVLITTTTKIFTPSTERADYRFTDLSDYYFVGADTVRVVLGVEDADTGKLLAPSDDVLQRVAKDFDYILIEADGSRNLPLKMWREGEPVISSLTTKTIGVIPIQPYGRKAEADFIFNYEGFVATFGNGSVDCNIYREIIQHRRGIFKNSRGSKILFINQVECEAARCRALRILSALSDASITKTYGSLLKGDYYGID
ncbi:selenium cofactor biosynthesis protein YqeC [Peptoniphilus equinus]|uniref:Selenium cofactor biosynthesis protein YqeC n=1 Tax=Peptoniphilus equinus TaxID=3016343 RepID=A0ABY7QUX5_9FIRM|nr:selenium cofactor biosynthesis protein YqeC [Peptoniphilus equinus]WBW50583.1 selenium cofactor biosynthesis protein YqeC [Peptoniphilus equinus]